MAHSPLQIKQCTRCDLHRSTGSTYQRRTVPSIQGNTLRQKFRRTERDVSRSVSTRHRDAELRRKRYVNVRYLNNIKNFKNRIKSSNTCNERQCKKIKERLDEHHAEHHSNVKMLKFSDPELLSDSSSTSRYHEMSLSSMESASVPYLSLKTKDSHSVQTDIKPIDKRNLQDNSHGPITSREEVDNNKQINDNIRNEIILKNTETREILTPKHNFYKEYVMKETVKWMKNLPMNAEVDAAQKILRDNIVNSLVEEIYQISKSINDENYDETLKLTIKKCLEEMPMWLPCVVEEQGPFKEKLGIELLNSINSLNKRLFREDKPSSSKGRSIRFDDNMKNKTKDHNKYMGDMDIQIIENEIREWQTDIKMETDYSGNEVTAEEISHLLLNNLEYLLREPKVAAQYKFTLKGEILEVLKKLPISVKNPATKTLHLYRLAEALANRLLRVQARYAKLRFNKVHNVMYQQKVEEIIETPTDLKNNLYTLIGDCLEFYSINYNTELLKEIFEIVLNSVVSIKNKTLQSHVDDITVTLQKYCNVSASKATDISKHIVIQVRNVLRDEAPTSLFGESIASPRLSGVISVYTFEERNTTPSFPITSTPKKVKIPMSDIPRQNPEEISLAISIAEAIREWMYSNLPSPLDMSGELSYREAITYELAGEIVETLRNAQLMPTKQDKDAVATTISTWLVKFEIFDDYESHINQIQNLYERIFEIIKTVPVLTKPHQGTRQAIGFSKYRGDESQLIYVAQGIDMLEDEISVWMNQQPADMYVNNDWNIRDRLIHELAEKVQEHLVNKDPEIDIQNDVKQWLNKVISPDAKVYLPDMIEELRDRLKRVPQDATLSKEKIEKMHSILQREIERGRMVNVPENDCIIDNTMKEFILKFLENYCVAETQLARRAITNMLKNELMKLKPPTRKDVYKKFAKSEPNALEAPGQFVQELEYINLLSDWLNMIPVDPNYTALGNKHRVNFIQYVSKYITAIENERSRAPGAMNYDLHLANIIMSYLSTLPIANEHKANMARMIDQLLSKLSTHRESIRQKANRAPIINDLGEFIDVYVRKYGVDIGDNETKIEIWTDRLMNEIQKIVYETSKPADLTQNQVYNKLANVSIPLNDTVESFVLEINYIKEIIEWMKNLPLAPIISKEDQDYRVELVSELAEKLFERKVRKSPGIADPNADADAVQYIAYWLTQFPLERPEEIIVAVVIKQLIDRVDRASDPQQSWDRTVSDVTRITGKSYPGVVKPEPRPKTPALKCKEYKNKPEALIVDAVEKFCNALPIRGDDQDAVKYTKNEIMNKVLQKTGELNVDPEVFNDPPLYRDVFTDEVNEIIDQAPLNQDAAKNLEKLKGELIDTIIDANAAIKEKSAGEQYKQELENVINTSIPNPVRKEPMSEPGFEMYKNRLVNMFILENFDHSNDELKLKYERQIKSEIDRFFECAQNRSAVPLTKDQIYNQLYSALFKVPIPNEVSVANEVEIVKTRCEIDKWFENLPLREAYNLNEQLEWDQILATLAKRIHEIETTDQNAQDKILKEIKKWLPMLPILPGKEGRFEEFAKMLQDTLKTTSSSRKCVASIPPKAGKLKAKKSKEPVKHFTGSASPPPKPSTKNLAKKPYKTPTTSNMPCCQSPKEPQERPVDLMLKAAFDWCNELPLLGSTVEELEGLKNIKEQIFTKILIKLSELNTDPEIFANDFMYNELLDEELENVLNLIPTNYDVQQSKEARKMQLKQQIAAIKMLMKKDKDRQHYKDTLKNTVVSVLEPPANMTSDKIEMFDKLVEEIVEDFVQLHYNKNDEEGRQYYKSKVQEAVLNKFYEIQDQPGTEPPGNPLLKINQLLCELAKIPLPDKEVLKDEVEEIRMREQVEEFFEQLPLPSKDEKSISVKNETKLSLAKQLANIEKSGHNCSNDNKMRSEIAKQLKKANAEVLPQVIDKFVQQLKSNEAERKAAPPEDTLTSEIRQEFDAVQVRPFGNFPQAYISGTEVHGNVFPGAGLSPAGAAAHLAVPGSGTRAPTSSGEPSAPASRSRVTFTPQATARAGSAAARAAAAAAESSELSDEDDERCRCGGRRLRLGGRRPTCVLRRNSADGHEYCVPMPRMWRRMPFPSFVYF